MIWGRPSSYSLLFLKNCLLFMSLAILTWSFTLFSNILLQWICNGLFPYELQVIKCCRQVGKILKLFHWHISSTHFWLCFVYLTQEDLVSVLQCLFWTKSTKSPYLLSVFNVSYTCIYLNKYFIISRFKFWQNLCTFWRKLCCPKILLV